MPPAWITVKTNKSQHLNSISPIKHFNEVDYWIWHKTHLAVTNQIKKKKKITPKQLQLSISLSTIVSSTIELRSSFRIMRLTA